MLTTRKMWLGIALVTTAVGAVVAAPAHAGDGASSFATEGGEAGKSGEGGEDAEAGYGGSSFDAALDKVLVGEGGEGGIGISFAAGQVTIPALTGAQITKAISGNTLRRDEAFAMHFQTDGKFSGWEITYVSTDASHCANLKSGAPYELEDGQCYQVVDVKVTDGRWSVKDGMLCTKPALVRAAERTECTSPVLILDKLALFDEHGKLKGKGDKLVRGKQLQEK